MNRFEVSLQLMGALVVYPRVDHTTLTFYRNTGDDDGVGGGYPNGDGRAHHRYPGNVSGSSYGVGTGDVFGEGVGVGPAFSSSAVKLMMNDQT